jgi:hypothetical protein
MIKKIEWVWNLIHYFIYRFDCWVYFAMSRPFKILYRFMNEKVFKKENPPSFEEMSSLYTSPQNGIATIYVFWVMTGISACLLLGVYMLCMLIPGVLRSMYVVAPLAIVAWQWNEFFIFRRDKYLQYFAKFDEVEGAERLKLKILFLISMSLVGSFFIGSAVLFLKFK